MKFVISKHTRIFLLFTLLILLGACNIQSSEGLDEATGIKIAVLPILDTLPMYVAEENGYFAQHNLKVEFVPAGSAPKRDELINSGQVDGMINEVVSTIFYNRDETRVQIVRYARVATSDSAIFRILSSGQSGISDVSDLKGVGIGVSKGTVIEYLTDRLLQAEGFSPGEIQVVAVPDIGQRMTLLGSGELDAAMLPDPLASLVMQQGAKLVLEDSLHPEFSHSVFSFRKEFIDQNNEVIEKFLAAIEEAVISINADPEKYSDLLVERKLVPAPLVGKFSVPKFTTAGVPTREQWDDVISWIIDEGIDVGNANYKTSITNKFLPK